MDNLSEKYIEAIDELLEWVEGSMELYFGVMSDGETAHLNLSQIHYEMLENRLAKDFESFRNPHGQVDVVVRLRNGDMPIITPIKNK